MSARATLKRLEKIIKPIMATDENMDRVIIAAIMDELNGYAPEGTADAIEARQHARTGYTFPHGKELREILQEVEEGKQHIENLRGTND